MSDVWKSAPARTLDDLLRNELGVNSHPGPESGSYSIGVAVQKVLSNNPNRVGLTFVNQSGSVIRLGMDNTISGTTGLYLAANGGTISFDWRTEMTMISNDWYAIAGGAASPLEIFEVVIQ